MEAKILRQIKAKRQFKALVRLVIANKEWLLGESDTAPKRDKVQIHSKKKLSALELKHKALLNKNAADRTEEEKMLLYRIVGGFKCFRKYPEHVKMLLAGCTYFAYFGPQRVIVKQHHKAEALYFIISGEVTVTTKSWDPQMNEEVVNELGCMVSGNMFGEDSLLNDIPRQTTITTYTPVEFLVLHREDFDLILRDSVKKEWDYITKAMKSFRYFDSWDDVDISECCMIAKIKTYEKDDTILGDGKGNKNWVYFVLKGSCNVIEHLLVEPEIRDNVVKYKLHKAELYESIRLANKKSNALVTESSKMLSYARSSIIGNRIKSRNSTGSVDDVTDDSSLYSFTSNKVEVRFMQVCIFNPKACFGLGESMERRRIVALQTVECLVIPRYFILTRGQSNIWSRIQLYLNQNIPKTKEVFFEFQEQNKWRKLKTDLIKRIPKMPSNVPQNVPYSIRIRQDFAYGQNFKYS